LRFFLLFLVLLPFIELYTLVSVAGHMGVFSTIVLLILMTMAGSAILKQQGLDTLRRANWKANAGQLPTTEISDGLMLAIGGLLFLIPGFVTDIIGLFFIIPFTRRLIAKWLLARAVFRGRVYTQTTNTYSSSEPKVIEGEIISKDTDNHT
jgi:UPF0716 protein FxsA